jgi:predicted peptidase
MADETKSLGFSQMLSKPPGDSLAAGAASSNGLRKGFQQFGWLELALVLSTVSLIIQLWPDAARVWREWPWPGYQTPARAEVSLADGYRAEIRYLLYLPPEYTPRRRWPLLLFLHGAGERGDDLSKVARRALQSQLASGKKRPPMIVVSPQCPANISWQNPVLLAFLDQLEKRFPIDPDRVYLAGHSMGAFGTWSLAATAPERFAAIIPAAGGGNPEDAAKLKDLAIWAFHGANDKTVPIAESQKMVDAIRAAGGHPKLTIYPDRGHDTCDNTFSRDDIYAWLLRQHRSK